MVTLLLKVGCPIMANPNKYFGLVAFSSVTQSVFKLYVKCDKFCVFLLFLVSFLPSLWIQNQKKRQQFMVA
jgi:hypothetical protein